MNLKSIYLSSSMMLICFFGVYTLEAVPNPAAIRWNVSSSEAFITSLYRGVLGRAPESRAIVRDWARLVIRNDPGSRFRVFVHFLESEEYLDSRWAKQRKNYSIYYHRPEAGRQCYVVARRSTNVVIGGRIYTGVRGGPYTFGVAQAIMSYRRVFLTKGLGDACNGIGRSSGRSASTRGNTGGNTRGNRRTRTTRGNHGTNISWKQNAYSLRKNNGSRYTFNCSSNGTKYKVWGINTYTDDSSICTAAVHFGLITLARGGGVTIEIRRGLGRYTGSWRNGVKSTKWGRFGGSFIFVRSRQVSGCGWVALSNGTRECRCGGSPAHVNRCS